MISVHGDVFCVLVLVNLRDVFSLIFHGVVVGDISFFGDLHSLSHLLIFHVRSFVRHVLNPGFASDRSLLDWGDLGDWLLDHRLNGGLDILGLLLNEWLLLDHRGSLNRQLSSVVGNTL